MLFICQFSFVMYSMKMEVAYKTSDYVDNGAKNDLMIFFFFLLKRQVLCHNPIKTPTKAQISVEQ